MKIPKTSKGLHSRIDQLKKVLRSEKKKFGCYDDSYGRRYLIGPLYLLAGDEAGGIRYYNWFQKNFPSDIGEPGMHLCWTLTLYRSGKIKKAESQFIRTLFSNLYIVPHLLGLELPGHSFSQGSNWETPDYMNYIPPEYFAAWTDSEIQWAKDLYERSDVAALRNRFIELEALLDDEPRGPERSKMVDELFALKFMNL